MQLQYVYFLFHSNDGSWRGPDPVLSGHGTGTGSTGSTGTGRTSGGATRVTPVTALPPRMTEQDVLQQAFRALQKLPDLIQATAAVDPSQDLNQDKDPRHRILYLITPTHKRVTQMVDMTRVSQTLQLAQLKYQLQLYWIVVEDSAKCTQRIRQLLLDSGIPFAHVAVPTVKTAEGHKGVDQRNKALNIIRQRLDDTS